MFSRSFGVVVSVFSGRVFQALFAIFFSYAFSLVIFSSVFFGSVSFFAVFLKLYSAFVLRLS